MTYVMCAYAWGGVGRGRRRAVLSERGGKATGHLEPSVLDASMFIDQSC